MAKDKKAGLKAMADKNSGASDNEKEVAAQKLQDIRNNEVPAVYEEGLHDKWAPQGQMVRTRNNANAFLRKVALEHFLEHVKDGEYFVVRALPTNLNFAQNDFYVIKDWLMSLGLMDKEGSSYSVPSRSKVRLEWNRQMELTKIK